MKIDELETLLGQSPQNNAELNEKLEKILERFDDVAKNPDYKVVAELQGFDVTQAALQQYINTMQREMAKSNGSDRSSRRYSASAPRPRKIRNKRVENSMPNRVSLGF